MKNPNYSGCGEDALAFRSSTFQILGRMSVIDGVTSASGYLKGGVLSPIGRSPAPEKRPIYHRGAHSKGLAKFGLQIETNP
jgi:hypothetical protein